eukprot:3452121-Pleurochrysis_carterae.AAC.1
MAAGDAQSLADADPCYVLMMDRLRDVLCVLSESEEDVQGLDSWILANQIGEFLRILDRAPRSGTVWSEY